MSSLQRDRPLIKDLLAEIDRYCARNLQEREKQLEAERRHQHEAQHTEQEGGLADVAPFTAGGGRKEEEEEEKEVDPALVGSLDDVYLDEPGTMMTEDPFRGKVMDDKEKPASLMEMEKSLDAIAVYSDEDLPVANSECLDMDSTSLDRGVRRPLAPNSVVGQPQSPDVQSLNRPAGEELPDVVGVANHAGTDTVSQGPDVASLPLDVAVGAQRSVDLLGGARQSNPGSNESQPVDLTDGLTRSNDSSDSQNT